MEVKNNGQMFYIGNEENPDAKIHYSIGKKGINVKSTQVDPEKRGQGLAGYITKYVIDYARKEGLKVNPVCSYTVKYFEKHPEDEDVMYKK
ncbi:MAG: GNAT family N-acetyltransferase [Miniphocaeibacter sp.]|uniref:GNAT family N-acetyltransferase n=1 Tax=Miniphocaeibacter sp. TaxID=3100973 RepID=UPI0017A58255|nr:N-acetyltransferase [Gallicola sp.]